MIILVYEQFALLLGEEKLCIIPAIYDTGLGLPGILVVMVNAATESLISYPWTLLPVTLYGGQHGLQNYKNLKEESHNKDGVEQRG